MTTEVKLETLCSVDVLVRARASILTVCDVSQTVAFATVWLGVLKHLGFRAEIVSVVLTVLNGAMVAYLEANAWKIPEEQVALKALAATGASFFSSRTIRKGVPVGDPYLAVLVRTPGGEGPARLIDLTAPVCHRPDKGIKLERPIVVDVETNEIPNFLGGKTELRGTLPDGALVSYNVIAGDSSYVPHPDWAERRAKWQVIIEELVGAIRLYDRGVRDPKDAARARQAESAGPPVTGGA